MLQDIRPALGQIREILRSALSGRVRDVVLYGSQARNDADSDSDIDLIVVLNGAVNLGRDLPKIIRAIYPVQLTVDQPIHVLPVSAAEYEAGRYGIYRCAKEEGVVV